MNWLRGRIQLIDVMTRDGTDARQQSVPLEGPFVPISGAELTRHSHFRLGEALGEFTDVTDADQLTNTQVTARR